MKSVYCSFCGSKSEVHHKVVKNYGIVDVIDPHECTKEMIPFDLQPTTIPSFVKESEDRKFVKHLDGLSGLKKGMVGSDELRDRRFEPGPGPVEQKSTAPQGALSALNLPTKGPERDMFDFENEGEKDEDN